MPTTINPSNQIISDHSVQVGDSDNLLTSISVGSAGQTLVSNGASANPSFQNVSATGAVTTIFADSGQAAPIGGVVIIDGGSTGLLTTASLDVLELTGTLKVEHGGTETTSFNAYGVVCGGTTSVNPLQSTTTGTSNQILASNGAGALPSFKNLRSIGAVTEIICDNGSATPNNGQLIIGGGSTGLVTSGALNVVALSGTLKVDNGGTEVSSFTPNSVICGGTNSTGPLQSVASVGVSGQVLTSFGPGALPNWADNLSGNVNGPVSSTNRAIATWNGTTGNALFDNSGVTITAAGNLSIARSQSSGTVQLNVTNLSATSNSNAEIVVTAEAGGDGEIAITTNGGDYFAWRLPSTGSFFLRFYGMSPAELMKVTSSGQFTYPLQPAFMAVLNATDANATGNGAVYTLGSSGTAMTKIFDQGNNFNTNGTFTAPVTGNYMIGAQFVISSISAAMNYLNANLVTSSGTYPFGYINPSNARTLSAAPNVYSCNCSVLVPMTAGDTFRANIEIAGGAGNTASIDGTGSSRVFMYANLVC